MEPFTTVIATLVGFIAGALTCWALLRKLARGSAGQQAALLEQKLQAREEDIAELRRELTQKEQAANDLRVEAGKLREQIARTEAGAQEREKAAREKLALLEQAETNLKDAFKALASETLQKSNESFLELARSSFEKQQQGAKGELEKRQEAIRNLVEPVQKKLSEFDQYVRELESKRAGAYEGLSEQVKALNKANEQLRTETGNLVTALRSPQVRGRWGEMQLRRAVELAGMERHINFQEQASFENDENQRLRPDMVVQLPGERVILLDSKVPLGGYEQALRTEDPQAQEKALADHARQVRDHIRLLGGKQYWNSQEATPDFVVLFLPGEAFLSAALRQDPGLLDYGFEQKVILATPTTLVALLKGVAYSWGQVALTEQAAQIAELGKQLYERLSTFGENFAKIGSGLKRAVENYNKAVGSLESRVFPTARRFPELAVSSSKELEALEAVDESPRPTTAEELTHDSSDADDERAAG